MFLKSLTLKGFKSFADSTTLEFEPGVTVVVGPNGSGKSNVVDAVAWVLGAQGPRTVRSAKMEDVIFAGTPKRPALGRAEVALTIDNSAGILPIDFSEVTVTRTLFRTGESEYAINRVPCRLLDIQDLLSDTGVGRQQHVIVSQGNLDAILNSRPEDRRMVIEEAAGILKYRRRKEKSERRLEATEGSLVRLQDLLREVRRQLRPLEKQADAARRHGDVVIELDAIRRYLAGRELVAVEGRLAECAQQRRELGRATSEVEQALARLDADVLRAEAELNAGRRRNDATDLGEALSRAEGLRARARGQVALLGERRRSIGRDLAATVDQDVISSLEAEADQLGSQLSAADADTERLRPEEAEVVAIEAALAAETAEVEGRWRPESPVVTDPAVDARAELGALRAGSERGRAELRRLQSRTASIEGRTDRLAKEAAGLEQVVAESESAIARLKVDVEATASRLADAEGALTLVEERRRSTDAEHHRWSARADALAQALDEARARAGAQRLAAVGGVVGTLLELVEVDQGWEDAFEAAAGEAMAAVVVDGVGAARQGLAELRRLAVAGAVVALPDLMATMTAGGSTDAGGLTDAGGSTEAGGSADAGEGLTAAAAAGRRVRSHVRARLPAVGRLLDGLLANAVVVDGDWSEALDLALDHPELVVVTRRGDRCAGGIWHAGAGGAGVTGAALEGARGHAEAAARDAERLASEVRHQKEHLESARSAWAHANRQAEANYNRRGASSDALERIVRELVETRSEAESANHQLEEAGTRLARDEARMGELEDLLPALEEAAAAEAAQAMAERSARARLAERRA
nr:AAA family ATPase [Actinomycetota bacterium]